MSQLPSLVDIFTCVADPRDPRRVEHPLPDVLTTAVCGVLVGADTFEEIALWAQEKEAWLRQYVSLPNGVPSHDTFARLFGLIDPQQFEAAFRRWVAEVLPGLSPQVVALDGKTSRRSAKAGEVPLHLVSAFAADVGVILGQHATATKSNEKTAIPELLATLALEGCIVTIDAMGTQPSIAQAIRDQQADYVLAVKRNQPQLWEAMDDFFALFQSAPTDKTPHQVSEDIDKGHGRQETRRCYVFDALECLPNPGRWPDMKSFAVIEATRKVNGKLTQERRCYISSLPPDAPDAAWLHDAAHGRDDRPVVTEAERKSVSRETTFERDLHPRQGRAELTGILVALCERVAADLQALGVRGRTVGIKLRYGDFRTLTRDHTLREPIDAQADLLAASRECLRRAPLDRPLRLLGVRVSALVPVAGVAENSGVWEQGELAFDE